MPNIVKGILLKKGKGIAAIIIALSVAYVILHTIK